MGRSVKDKQRKLIKKTIRTRTCSYTGSQSVQNHESTARDVIEQIWVRARINAFAHRAVHEEASKSARIYFVSEIVTALFSILFVILVYIFSGSNFAAWMTQETIDICKLIFTLLSITLTLSSLFLSIIANNQKFDVMAVHHEQLQNRYQYLAQRAREIKWPGVPVTDVVALLKELERDFQLLKALGDEPSDKHFDEAFRIFKKIKNDDESKLSQSFVVGRDVEAGQIAGGNSRAE